MKTEWIDLGNPSVRHEPVSYSAFEWPSGNIESLRAPNLNLLANFYEVVTRRRTRRKFADVDVTQLSSLLWISYRELAWASQPNGIPLTLRSVPSAGSIHPIHILIVHGGKLMRYLSDRHALEEVNCERIDVKEIEESVNELLSAEKGSIILFAAEPGKTFSKYADACSLIWRDVGILIGNLALAAEAQETNFCPLGITGEPWISRLDKQGRLIGVGMALWGAR